MKTICKNCDWWKPQESYNYTDPNGGTIVDDQIGACKKCPPAIGQPVVMSDDYCGEFRNRKNGAEQISGPCFFDKEGNEV